MNNPVREIIQEKYEAKILRSMSSITNIDTALECRYKKSTWFLVCWQAINQLLMAEHYKKNSIKGYPSIVTKAYSVFPPNADQDRPLVMW